MIPNFFLIGAQKAGTTTLWHLLRQHPDVFMCEPKEPVFFSKDEVFARGFGWYESLFRDVSSENAIGEASANYYLTETWPNALPRIKQHVPHARLIFCVRHPLERVKSAWMQYLTAGHPVSRRFSRAVREYPRIVEGSKYWQTVQACRELFDDDRLLIVFFEDLKARPAEVVANCYRFLDVSADFAPSLNYVVLNASAGKRAPTPVLGFFNRGIGRAALKRTCPWRVRQYLKKHLLTTKLRPPSWDDRTRRWVVAELRGDARRFLGYAGKPTDYWEL